METLYRAFDGKIFNDYDDCWGYEQKVQHPNLFSVELYDKKDAIFHILPNDMWNDKFYSEAEKVHIHNEKELEDFIWWAKECGWCEFEEEINSPGFWVRTVDEYNNGTWNKEIKGE